MSTRVYIQPPKMAKFWASLGLEARRRAPKAKKCCLTTREAGAQGIGSGIARARDIIAGKRVDARQVKAYFDRHRRNYENAMRRAVKSKLSLVDAAEREPAIQGWWIWGGDDMYEALNPGFMTNPGHWWPRTTGDDALDDIMYDITGLEDPRPPERRRPPPSYVPPSPKRRLREREREERQKGLSLSSFLKRWGFR